MPHEIGVETESIRGTRNLARIFRLCDPVVCVLMETDSVELAVSLMTEASKGAVLVVDARGALRGVFTERDLMTRVVYVRRDPRTTALCEVMTRHLVVATPEEPVTSALQKMQDAGCRHLPVMVDGAVLGMLSMRDILGVQIAEKDRELDAMRSYIHGSY